MKQGSKDRIRLLMNSKEIKDFRDSLVKDLLFGFRIGSVRVSAWKSFPFLVVTRHQKARTK